MTNLTQYKRLFRNQSCLINSQLRKRIMVLTNQNWEAGTMLQMTMSKSKMINHQLRELPSHLIRKDTNPKEH
jgi:hypothetical protein